MLDDVAEGLVLAPAEHESPVSGELPAIPRARGPRAVTAASSQLH